MRKDWGSARAVRILVSPTRRNSPVISSEYASPARTEESLAILPIVIRALDVARHDKARGAAGAGEQISDNHYPSIWFL